MKKNWPEARKYCQKLTGPDNPGNGDLVSIHSSDENDIMSSDRHSFYHLFRNYWIGLNRLDTQDK